jgi:hypothetical protein
MAVCTEDDMKNMWEAGFEAGVAYTFGHIPSDSLTFEQKFKFADWAELKCPWRSKEEWLKMTGVDI